MPPRICVVGSCNLDLTFRVPRLPRPGETVAAHAMHQGFGGKGANQAVAAARLGANVTMVARVGDDAFGRSYVENLQAHGIDSAFVTSDASLPTGTASIFVSDAGENCIVVAAGANAAVAVDDVRAAADAIRGADVVICQLETPIAAAVEAFEIARSAGVRTLLNPAPATNLPAELLQLCDLCVPNETELELLTAHSLAAPRGLQTAAQILRDRGAKAVVVTLGALGALVAGDVLERIPTFSVNAVDPTGAGDVFIAALAFLLAGGNELSASVCFANAAAAISVTRPGAQSAAPMLSEVTTLLATGEPGA
jgi:ribokinase